MSTPLQRLREAIQAVIDAEGDGEHFGLTQFVIVMGLERVTYDGGIEATSWYYVPPDQADWMTTGLLETGIEMRACAGIDDD